MTTEYPEIAIHDEHGIARAVDGCACSGCESIRAQVQLGAESLCIDCGEPVTDSQHDRDLYGNRCATHCQMERLAMAADVAHDLED